jgi:hypothetical protein
MKQNGYPFLPEDRLKRASRMKEIIDVVKVSEIGVDLDNPIRPTKNNSNDVNHRNPPRQKRSILHPGNDIVQCPGYVETDCRDG